MKTQYLPRFLKDLKALKSTAYFETIKELVFNEIPSYLSFEEIQNLKKLKDAGNHYRIRIGDYRIGLVLNNKTVTFVRVLHRREIYRYFP